MSAFLHYLKQHWKFVLAGFGSVSLLFVVIIIIRVLSFVGDTTGGGRTSSLLTSPTPDAPATATAQARYNQLFAPATGQPTGQASGTTPATPTPDPRNLPPATATPIPLSAINSKIVDRIRSNQPITFMFLGYNGLEDAESTYLTDSILVLRYDPMTKTITQFSIPRDIYCFVAYGGAGKGYWTKINGVFTLIMRDKIPQNELDPKYRVSGDDKNKKHDAAANLVADTLEPIINLKIDYWATMNYRGFHTLIDALGGVEVNVERSFIDKKYPKNDNDRVDASFVTVEFKAGLQKMDGETAIRFSRSRYSESEEGGDFARSRRQMKVITAIKDKVLKENLFSKLPDIMSALQGNIRFSMNSDDLLGLVMYFQSSEGKQIATEVKTDPEPIGNTPGNEFWVDSEKVVVGYILLPSLGQGNYSAVHKWVKRAVDNADIRRENLRIQVLNASGKVGLANLMTDYLLDNGFRLIDAGNAPTVRDETTLMDYSQGQAAGHIKRLQGYIADLKVIAADPATRPPDTYGDLQLYIGKNFKGNPGVANSNQGQGGNPNSVPPPSSKR